MTTATAPIALTAAALVRGGNPVAEAFHKACKAKGVEPTKRQASKWLQRHPSMRTIKVRVG